MTDGGQRLRRTVEGAGGTLACQVDTLLRELGCGEDGAERRLSELGLESDPGLNGLEHQSVVLVRVGSAEGPPNPQPSAEGDGSLAILPDWSAPTGEDRAGAPPTPAAGEAPTAATWKSSDKRTIVAFLVACALVGVVLGRLGTTDESTVQAAGDRARVQARAEVERATFRAGVDRGRRAGAREGARTGARRGAAAGAREGRKRAAANPIPPPAAPQPSRTTPAPAPARPAGPAPGGTR